LTISGQKRPQQKWLFDSSETDGSHADPYNHRRSDASAQSKRGKTTSEFHVHMGSTEVDQGASTIPRELIGATSNPYSFHSPFFKVKHLHRISSAKAKLIQHKIEHESG
jgi:hypothetical protein